MGCGGCRKFRVTTGAENSAGLQEALHCQHVRLLPLLVSGCEMSLGFALSLASSGSITSDFMKNAERL